MNLPTHISDTSSYVCPYSRSQLGGVRVPIPVQPSHPLHRGLGYAGDVRSGGVELPAERLRGLLTGGTGMEGGRGACPLPVGLVDQRKGAHQKQTGEKKDYKR